MAKFPKKDYPVIFIGLGGTGKDAVRAIKHKFEEHLECEADGKPRRTAYLVLDADSDNTEEFGQDYIDLTVPEPGIHALLANPGTMTPAEKRWFNTNLPDIAIAYGAGCIRQVGRLQLFRKFDDIKSKFISRVTEIAKSIVGNTVKKVDIVICAGLTGGTGSGTFIDMGYLASEWVEKDLGYATKTYGFFTMPDLYMDGANQERKKANAYAALKELDYLQNVTSPQTRMEHEQLYPDNTSIDWKKHPLKGNRRPYDLAFLLSGRFESGVPIAGNAKEEIFKKLSEMMLCCYADEDEHKNAVQLAKSITNDSTNNVTSFSFDAFMSNVAAGLWDLNTKSTRPVNFSFASLGFGSSNVVEEYIQQYETEAVLEKVLTVPLFDQQGNPAAAGHKAEYKKKDAQGVPQLLYTQGSAGVNPFLEVADNKKAFVKDVFAPETAELDFGQILEIEDKRFAGICGYTPRPLTFDMLETVKAEDVINHIEQFVGREGAEGWRTAASTLAATMENTQWQNFISAAKDAIRKANVGPAALADYLAKSFVPDMDELVQKWAARSNNKKTAAETQAKTVTEKIRTGLNPKTILGRIGGFIGTPLLSDADKTKLVSDVKKAWGEAGAAMRSSIFATARYNSMRAFTEKVKNYLNNLITLNNALLTIQDEAGEKLASAAQTPNPHALVSAGQIKDYFDSVAGRDHAVARARDSILAELAETSFSLAAPPKNATYAQLQDYNDSLLGAIGRFISQVHDNMNMGTLDWIVDVDPVVAAGNEAAKIQHVKSAIADKLESMAMPMLPKLPGCAHTENYRLISVPYDAPVLLAGFKSYIPNDATNTVGVKASLATDRITWLNIKTGSALLDIASIEDLHRAYESFQDKGDAAAGFHLNDSYWAGEFGSSYLRVPEQAGALLPGVFYHEVQNPELFETQSSEREKNNWEFAKNTFSEAVRNGLVDFKNPNGFTVTILKKSVNANEFFDKVDQGLGRGSLEDKLKYLNDIERDEFGETEAIAYKQYLPSLSGKPLPNNADPAEKEENERKKEEKRNELCAYLFMRRPNYLFSCSQYGKCVMNVRERRAKLEREARKARSIAALRFYISGRISYSHSSFQLKNGERTDTLFRVDRDKLQCIFRIEKMDPEMFAKINQKYLLALFYKLYEEAMKRGNVNDDILKIWETRLSVYSGELTVFERDHAAEYKEYKEAFAEQYQKIKEIANTDAGTDWDAFRSAYQEITKILEDDSFDLAVAEEKEE